MSGQEKLSFIAFVVSMCVIIGFALIFSILFSLYSTYKIKHVKLGHEDEKIIKSLKNKYRNVYNDLNLITKDKETEENVVNYKKVQKSKIITTFVRQDLKKKKEKQSVKEQITYYDSLMLDQKKSKKFQTIANTFFGILYVALFIIFGFALGFRLSNEQLFFKNTTLLTIQTGSMETVYSGNTYIKENNLTNQIKQYSLIGINKLEKEEDIKLFDIVAYKNSNNQIIVHRVIRIYENPTTNITYYTLKGDANTASLNDELTLIYENIIGKYNGFQNYGLGVTLIYIQSNIGLVALAASYIFLITYNVSEDKIEKTYDKKFIELTHRLDEELIKNKKIEV